MVQFWGQHKAYFEEARQANIDYHDESHADHRLALSYVPKGAKVLDVGCGTAEAGKEIAKFAHYYGIDVSPLGLSMAKEYQKGCQHNYFELVTGDAACLPFPDETFDVIISLYALEHFIEPLSTLQEMDRVLKPSGIVILISPAYDCPLAIPPSTGLGAINIAKGKLSYMGKSYSLFNLPIAVACILKRGRYALQQLWRQIALYTLKKDIHIFSLVSSPACLKTEYSQDNDVLYIVSIREIANWFHFRQGYEILHLNRGKTKFCFAEFFFVNKLFIVAKKAS
jgi:ubiquinone/menaquinone biosynthesis C-methylase UbiE